MHPQNACSSASEFGAVWLFSSPARRPPPSASSHASAVATPRAASGDTCLLKVSLVRRKEWHRAEGAATPRATPRLPHEQRKQRREEQQRAPQLRLPRPDRPLGARSLVTGAAV